MKDEVEKLIREWLNSHNLQHIYLDKKFKADLKNAQQTAQVEAVRAELEMMQTDHAIKSYSETDEALRENKKIEEYLADRLAKEDGETK